MKERSPPASFGISFGPVVALRSVVHGLRAIGAEDIVGDPVGSFTVISIEGLIGRGPVLLIETTFEIGT